MCYAEDDTERHIVNRLEAIAPLIELALYGITLAFVLFLLVKLWPR